MITWDDSMSTGVPEIDAQHKELLDKMNEFADALEHGKGRGETGEMLDFLQFYAQWHFQREEACMDQHQCPVAAFNKQAHRQFTEKFGQLYEQYQHSNVDPRLITNTYAELQNWFVNHIRRVDAQLYTCVKEQHSQRENSQ
ncbi:MAG: hemerythrin family protein [Anaerolineae bacterium]|nr:hemerythrin family protein [Anaerolineae bacterium]